ncbi:MAG: hypothetical protein KJ040_03885 [Gammaproteobacteria bacterium]|nr:hypothetical protein [Gammaproteobacteria bacterium]
MLKLAPGKSVATGGDDRERFVGGQNAPGEFAATDDLGEFGKQDETGVQCDVAGPARG